MDLYIHSLICLHGVVFSELSIGTDLPFMSVFTFYLHGYVTSYSFQQLNLLSIASFIFLLLFSLLIYDAL
jgi:hypothetical protein